MQKIKNIEFLRLLFMLSVVWMHLTAEIAKTTGLDCYKEFAGHFANGGKAVDGFFIISGFLFYLTFKHSTTVIDFIYINYGIYCIFIWSNKIFFS